jgi:hypothetical protein
MSLRGQSASEIPEDALFDALDEAIDAGDWPRLARLEVELWAVGPLRRPDDFDPEFIATAHRPFRGQADAHFRTPRSCPAWNTPKIFNGC